MFFFTNWITIIVIFRISISVVANNKVDANHAADRLSNIYLWGLHVSSPSVKMYCMVFYHAIHFYWICWFDVIRLSLWSYTVLRPYSPFKDQVNCLHSILIVKVSNTIEIFLLVTMIGMLSLYQYTCTTTHTSYVLLIWKNIKEKSWNNCPK